MRTAQAVAWKEIVIYFSSPIAYIVGLIFLALIGFFVSHRDLGRPVPSGDPKLGVLPRRSLYYHSASARVLTMRLDR